MGHLFRQEPRVRPRGRSTSPGGTQGVHRAGRSRIDATRLEFDGINYGQHLAQRKKGCRGIDRLRRLQAFSIDVTAESRRRKNVLAVEVIPPEKASPRSAGRWTRPARQRQGLFREVRSGHGEFSIENPFVITKLDWRRSRSPSHHFGGTREHADRDITGTLEGRPREQASPARCPSSRTKRRRSTHAGNDAELIIKDRGLVDPRPGQT